MVCCSKQSRLKLPWDVALNAAHLLRFFRLSAGELNRQSRFADSAEMRPWLPLSLVLCLVPAGCASGGPKAFPERFAHAMGEIDERTYSNSLEAWQLHRDAGCRFFEVDLWNTPDGRLVAAHDHKRLGLPRGYTHKQFMDAQVFGRYTPLDAEAIAQLLADDGDWTLVTDIKNGFSQGLRRVCAALEGRGEDCRERVVPQIYNISADLDFVNRMGFSRVILTLYRTRITDQQVIAALRENPNVLAVTMSTKRWNPDFVRAINSLARLTYVHTVNGEADIARLQESGIYGVYTDDSCVAGR